MAEAKGGGLGNFPWASAAVLVAFVASTQLVPHAFEPLRPPEKARAQAPLDPDLEVSARLWEDPFAALRRYEGEWADRCENIRKQSAQKFQFDCRARAADARDPKRLLARLDGDHDLNLANTLVVLSLMPGADFVGAEEARRRIRYATLAGLLSQDYVPDNPERLSLLEFDLLGARPATAPARLAATGSARLAAPASASESGTVKDGFVVPYELLSLRQADPPNSANEVPKHYTQVALLWVDETSLPLRKLDALARLTDQLMGQVAQGHAQFKSTGDRNLPKLAVIGPSSTDALRVALRDLQCAADLNNVRGIQLSKIAFDAAARCATNGAALGAGLPTDVLAGYRLLSRAEFYNPASTAPSQTLVELDQVDPACRIPHPDRLNTFLTHQFSRLTEQPLVPLALAKPGSKPGSNPGSATVSASALEGTGAAVACQPVQMIRTVGEDAQLIDRLVGEIELRLPGTVKRRIVLVAERDSLYAQSLVTQLRDRLPPMLQAHLEVVYFFRGIDGITGKEAGATPATPTKTNPVLEWPESRDQLDYLRRLGSELKRSESNPKMSTIGAIGILGNDVHDKLLVLQALHENFSDRMFFTTDMDARYLHPRTQAFTRNLVVASSLPLAFYPKKKTDRIDLQAGTPPLRDIYQTSTYVAARQAGCRSQPCKQLEQQALAQVLGQPSVYEIGRAHSVPLSGYALQAQPVQSAAGRIFVVLTMMVVIGCALFVWPSTPAVRQARRVLFPTRGPCELAPMDVSSVVLVALHAALLSYALAGLIEFVLPGRLDFGHARLLTGLTTATVLAVGLTALRPSRSESLRMRTRVRLLILGLLVLAWLWLGWPQGGWQPGGVCERCEPATWFEGVSAWPSHLIHLLALFALLWTLDWAWAEFRERLWRDSDWLKLPRPPSQAGLRVLLRHWVERASVMFWKPGVGFSCDFEQLWQEYGTRGEVQARAARVAQWYLLTVGLVALLFFGLSDGQVPEVPVRGDEHRQMVRATLYALLLLLPLLIVTVADATVLLVRFLRHLNAGRSFFPQPTLDIFAKALGDEQAGLWSEHFCARPEERNKDGSGFAVHTLLDDWIDVQVVAQRSAPVARLVVGPFVVLALLVVARSRLFDNWALTPAIAVGVSFYAAVLIGLTLVLKQAAENTRRRALESMQADLRWLAGSGKPRSDLVEPYKRLIAAVENEQRGAFAPFFDQPLLKAMLVPLGGAGGTQLFDYVLLGH